MEQPLCIQFIFLLELKPDYPAELVLQPIER